MWCAQASCARILTSRSMNCHSCQHPNLCGAIFCHNCGTSLLPQDRRRDTTAMLGRQSQPRPTTSTTQSASKAVAAGERRFRATVLNNGRLINLPLAVPVLIGRQDSTRGFFPDLDLNNDGGHDSGVSRRHARVSVIEANAYIEDLDSANGTFINDQRLTPRTPYRIQPSDELRLGSLILRVEHI